ncbi:hypothetical protein Tco_1392207 [Tanacetum coccineum]
MGLWYSKDFGFELIAYSDADHAWCNDDCKSTSGGIQFLGDKLVSWSSKKQDCTTMSTTDVSLSACLFHMAQQIIPAAQLVPNFKTLGNATIMLCSKLWKTVHNVPNTKDTIRFKLDTQEITYIVDLFRDTLKLPVETPENPFVVPATIEIIESFMHTVSYQDLMKKFPSIPSRIEEDYHSIKDDIPLVSVYTTGNVTVRGMLIPNAFLTNEIRAIEDYKEYETVFVNVVVLINQPQPVVSTQGTHRSHKKHPEVVVDDDNNKEEKKDEMEGNEVGSLDTRTEKMQTLNPITPRSPRINLSSDKNIAQELTDTISLSTPTTSKDSHMQSIFPASTIIFQKVHGKVDQVLHEIILQLAERAIDDLIERNLKPIIADTIIQDHDAFQAETNVIQVHPTTTTSTETTSSADLQQQLYLKIKSNLQDQANDPALWYVLKSKDSTSYASKQLQQQQEWDDWEEKTIINEDEVIPQDETPELIIEFQNVDKRVPTIFDHARMETTLDDMLSS